MIYTKPKDMRFVDMVIWVDKNMYKDDCDDEKLYEYLYLIISMLASKKKLMNTWSDYMDFYMWAASRVYMRIKSKKQYEYNEDGTPKQEKIRSILNFVKFKLSGLAVDFIRERNKENGKRNRMHSIEVEPCNTLHDAIDDNISGLRVADFRSYMNSIPETIKAYMNKLPYVNNYSLFMNIYTSTLLSFLNSITLSIENKNKLNRLRYRADRLQDELNIMYAQERENSTILYHLDESYRDYITVLTRCISHIIMNDLSQMSHESMVTDNNMKSLMIGAMEWQCDDGGFDER